MDHDVEADWLLFRTCNYRCGYCFFSERHLGEPVRVHATPEAWGAALDRTGRTWLLHLTGGEPSHYPDFVSLCERLTARHRISLNTNLTGASTLEFAQRVDPERVHFINAGLHPAERARRNGHERFLRHAEALLARGFPLMVTVVATPEALREFEALVDRLKPLGIVPFPKLLQGPFRGTLYPEGYSAQDRARFRRYSIAAERDNQHVFAVCGERPSIDPTLGRAHLEAVPDYRGRLCTAGREFVALHPDGDVVRCGNGRSMGNVLAGTLRLKKKAKACDRKHCFYFCEKFTARAAQEAPRTRSPLRAAAQRVRRLLGTRTPRLS